MNENDPPPPSSTPPPPPSTGLSARNWCTLIHISPLISVWTGIGHIAFPLILWLIKKDGNPEIDATGRNVLNFQISYTIYFLIAGILCLLFIGFLLVPILGIAWLVLILVGTIKSSNGEDYIYPWCIRFL